MEQKIDALEIFFNDEAKSILFNLVDRKDPSRFTFDSKDDHFGPTISAVFQLFHDLMIENTPDLYQAEWLRICRAIQNTRMQKQRLPISIALIRSKLLMSLEDTNSLDGEINNFELSKKIAGFDSITLCSIFYHSQKYIVAKNRNENYHFPEIQHKGY
jgi:hypothetical protein